jgi:hypothetical protein
VGTEEWCTYSVANRSRQADRRRSRCRSLSYYVETADFWGFCSPLKPYYNVVAFLPALSRCSTTEILHLQVRRVCISSETESLSLGHLVMSAGVPLSGPAWHRSADGRKAQSVWCEAVTLSDRGRASEAMPSPTRRDMVPKRASMRASGPIGQARIVTRMGGDKALPWLRELGCRRPTRTAAP